MEVVGVALDHPGDHRQARARHLAGEALGVAQLLANRALMQAAGGDDLQSFPVGVSQIQAADVNLQLAPHGAHPPVHGLQVLSHSISWKRSARRPQQ